MLLRRSLFIASILFSLLVLAFYPDYKRTSAPCTYITGTALSGTAYTATRSEPLVMCKYYTESQFYQSVENSSGIEGMDSIKGGIVPHHLVAGTIISSFFDTLSKSNPGVIILIGPNHKRIGKTNIHTGYWDWATPFGVLETDRDLAGDLVNSFGARQNLELLEEEHSINVLIPYIKYYMPESKVVPVLLHGNLDMDTCIELAEWIQAILRDKEALMVSSIDFSHYLPPENAYEMDDRTLDVINNMDYNQIINMNNDYLDSPPALITILKTMELNGSINAHLLAHSNSSTMSGLYSESTTSYLSILYH